MRIKDALMNFRGLETRRVRLRRIDQGDIEDIFEYASLAKVCKYTLWEKHESLEDTLAFIHWVTGGYQQGGRADWGVELKENGKLIGMAGFTGFSMRANKGELGYVLNPRWWDKGLVTEAVKRIIEFGFQEGGLHKIAASCAAANLASQRVLEKSGMRLEGTFAKDFPKHGAYLDIRWYGILREDFEMWR